MKSKKNNIVFFDTNEGSFELGYALHLPRSLVDLQNLGPELVEGVRVIIRMPYEIEMEATLKFDDESGHWLAMPVAGTIKYLDVG